MRSQGPDRANQYKRKCCLITKPYKPVCSLPRMIRRATGFRSLGTGFRSGQRRIINDRFFSGRSPPSLSLSLPIPLPVPKRNARSPQVFARSKGGSGKLDRLSGTYLEC